MKYNYVSYITNLVHYIHDMTVFRCDKKVSNVTLLKEKQKYQVTFLCENGRKYLFTSLYWKSKNTNLSQITLDKRYWAGLCSLNKLNRIAFVSWLHSFMTETKVSCYIPLREKKNHITFPYINLSQILHYIVYFTVSVILNKLQCKTTMKTVWNKIQDP